MGVGIMRNRSRGLIPRFTYTGNYELIDEKHGNWRIKFLTSGTLVFQTVFFEGIDVFLVGGGGGRAQAFQSPYKSWGGGGSGYTRTEKQVHALRNTEYAITIGQGGAGQSGTTTTKRGDVGGNTSAFGFTALGGNKNPDGTDAKSYAHASQGDVSPGSGGNGGSGGGRSEYSPTGGVDGGNGNGNTGIGQGTTTREFGEPDGDLYATGGGTNTTNADNSGDGGSWSHPNGSSGIVVIRNHRR